MNIKEWLLQQGKVQSGIFQGMWYGSEAVGSALWPKLLGTYEKELEDVLNQALAGRYDSILNVGAAEGWYTVGAALKMPKIPVFAYEIDPKGRELMYQNAAKNDVLAQLFTQERCSLLSVQRHLATFPKTLVIMDVEGDEFNILFPYKAAQATILVEIHDFLKPNLSTVIRNRFQESHDIKEVWSVGRSLKDLPCLPMAISAIEAVELMSEHRPKMSWFYMTPKGRNYYGNDT